MPARLKGWEARVVVVAVLMLPSHRGNALEVASYRSNCKSNSVKVGLVMIT
jgi:hypothetical protein